MEYQLLSELVELYPNILTRGVQENEYVLLDDLVLELKGINFRDNETLICKSERKSIKCNSIKCRKVTAVLNNLKIESPLIIESSPFIMIQQCNITMDDCQEYALIEIQRSTVLIKDSEIHCNEKVSINILHNSQVLLKKDTIQDSNCTLINVSSSKLIMEKTTVKDSRQNGIYSQENSVVQITDSELTDIQYPSIYAMNCQYIVERTKFSNLKQNGITFVKCKAITLKDCFFDNIESSAISCAASKIEIDHNEIKNINGNGAYISDSSRALITNNTITDCQFPSIALLYGCVGQITGNYIRNMDKSGICFRGSKQVLFQDNTIDIVGECGISVSDTTDIIINHNKILNCMISACESYNSSNVVFKSNEIDGNYPYGLLVYSGGKIDAVENTFNGVTKAICQLRYKGSASVKNNRVSKHVQPYDGQTSRLYVFEGNGECPPATNIQEEADRLHIPCDPLLPQSSNKCIKCQEGPRDCYFQDCGHCIYCMSCGQKALKNKESCPLCRFPIIGVTSGFSEDSHGLCTICNDNEANCIIFPCGHTGFCDKCLSRWYEENKTCPFCRQDPSTFKKIETSV
ncbi:hypothetical protein TVAG_325630 [Trichomonas vaginalis G3]|uniref:RING-type domain-containing protein n=1 Tax=Trichomonas vaginalis (strain ATCC PRA-98 / G3) TaxID=412133 RepID=A2EWG4_TRIV3|nr:protein ubiquitination [Trichomonas vaginalis G3]EAY02991.1 hypothetical protein TVAG_325630 [Trichomonas vaginalis G3]KAI5501763.1 protein ubiquitination [Trichomonas vaginalis G3]|eukprot:XP_001315214.1 hypothetical protein [Trichomonas vaginalis G3]